ncbi:MAG: hypothetical protein DCC58_07060 [Chloroflexi bacterium]|nr:MAG: hypothetical protein DCC58_07060 [Chloroflexota bacterium]
MRNSASLRHPASSLRRPAPSGRVRQSPVAASDGQQRRLARLVVVFAIVPAALLLLTALIAGRPPTGQEIERGVSVAGIPVSGNDWEQAAAALQARYDPYLAQPITLKIGDSTAVVTPDDLGLTVDMPATRERAQSIGRGSLVSAAGERLQAHTRGIDLAPVITLDEARFVEVLHQLSLPIVKAPADASYAWQSGQIAIVASSNGVGIDARHAAELLSAHVANRESGPLSIPTLTLAPAITTENLTRSIGQARELAGAPLHLRFNDVWWELRPADLVYLLTWDAGKVQFSEAKLAAALGALSVSINQEAVNAEIGSWGDGTFYVAEARNEQTLNVAASVAAVLKAGNSDDRVAELVVESEPPQISTERLIPLRDRANDIIARGLAVSWPEGEQWLDPIGLAGAMRFDEINVALTFDHAALAALIEPIANELNRPAAGLRWRSGVLVADDTAEPGRVVDLGASANAIASAALSGQDRVPLVINESSDPGQSAAGIVIREMLSSASTYYGSSSANRRTNIELAAAALDGALVAPGGTFSFNNAIGGTATLDDGYQMGFGIIAGTDGTPRTVPSVAGGICQVATTVFQSAFWAGMPIGTRNWHLYWIPNYGTGPGGMTGLDATVDPDYGLDFTFDNPTSDWLAIRAVADGEWITVEIWGTDQGWQVHADDPVITNVVKADTTMRRQFSDQLEPGQEIVVEHAEDGFTATIHRVVTKDGVTISESTFTSYYLPSSNVTLVGPGVPLEVTPEPTAVPQETPVTKRLRQRRRH